MSIKSSIAGCLCAIVAGSFVGSVTGYLETNADDLVTWASTRGPENGTP